MITSQHPVNQNDAWNGIYNSCPFRIWNEKWRSHGILKSYSEFKICLFLHIFNFGHICARADFFARAYNVVIGREGLEISLNCWQYRNPKHVKKWRFHVPYQLCTKKRARGNFWNAQNGLKHIVNLKWSHLEHFLILTWWRTRLQLLVRNWRGKNVRKKFGYD